MFQKTDIEQRIDRAFLELYAQKRVDEIRIREITEMAQCNRRSYYNYYEDIYDQKRKLASRFLEKYREIVERSEGRYNEEIISFIRENRPFFRAFLGRYRDYEFLQEVVELHIRSYKGDILDRKKAGNDPRLDIYPVLYNVFGSLMCITFWTGVDNPLNSVTLNEFVPVIERLQSQTLE
ncbi:MAG: TetR/AcrR family transcriptional regulator [Erysipelotrichaceae bacterium]|nr:TetR/AcrR family transcriptional regulator [Erysipelotrichaceae bacterium]